MTLFSDHTIFVHWEADREEPQDSNGTVSLPEKHTFQDLPEALEIAGVLYFPDFNA